MHPEVEHTEKWSTQKIGTEEWSTPKWSTQMWSTQTHAHKHDAREHSCTLSTTTTKHAKKSGAVPPVSVPVRATMHHGVTWTVPSRRTEEDDLGVADQGDGHTQLPLHATRQGVGLHVHLLSQTHLADDLGHRARHLSTHTYREHMARSRGHISHATHVVA